MYYITSTSGHTGYGQTEFVCDTTEDINDISIDCKPGSTIFVIDTTDVYMMNCQHEWKKIT